MDKSMVISSTRPPTCHPIPSAPTRRDVPAEVRPSPLPFSPSSSPVGVEPHHPPRGANTRGHNHRRLDSHTHVMPPPPPPPDYYVYLFSNKSNLKSFYIR